MALTHYKTERYKPSNELCVTAYDGPTPMGSTYVKTEEEAKAWFDAYAKDRAGADTVAEALDDESDHPSERDDNGPK
jgi:hypothetical protein